MAALFGTRAQQTNTTLGEWNVNVEGEQVGRQQSEQVRRQQGDGGRLDGSAGGHCWRAAACSGHVVERVASHTTPHPVQSMGNTVAGAPSLTLASASSVVLI